MKYFWTEEDLIAHFTLSEDEHRLLAHKSAPARLGFAVLLKSLQYEGRFPASANEVPKAVVRFLAKQIDVAPQSLADFQWRGRTIEYQRSAIRKLLGFRKWRTEYVKRFVHWLQMSMACRQGGHGQLKEALLEHLQTLKIEPPKKVVLERIIDSAVRRWEDDLFSRIAQNLPARVKHEMDLLLAGTAESEERENPPVEEIVQFRQLKADPGDVSLQSILNEAAKLAAIRKIQLPDGLFMDLSPKAAKRYRDRVMSEPAREMRRHPTAIRYALFAIFLYLRGREITDSLVDLLIQVVHRIGARAEKSVTKEIVENVKKVTGKEAILFKMASAAWDHPDDSVREAIFPAVGEKTIQDIIREYKHSGSAYTVKVNTRMRASYRNHYRRMLPAILNALEIRSNNSQYRPIIDAVALMKKIHGTPALLLSRKTGSS